ncbi:DNA binding protein [Pseudomonas putida]|uniref:histone-like nucleoid-structuring protein, MvaT/MvaU family n=1 Tax=Pseudomonas putida TaxID=303 RepID=UPI0023649581|nr:histone-like nucleoid-structuring protein, MvaT/MvaU family [Pseudomonas putida]MDD2139765.1 DNA binding protein [Pseudomonas putida]HDS1721689.1 DNA binding protein [Pseudomonas putida]
MSIVQKYRETQATIEQLKKDLASMEGNEGLKQELEFEEKLRGLMGEYGKSLRDVISLLDPEFVKGAIKPAKQASTRQPRKVKVYKNPHNGEVIETKGGNHKTLKEWKAAYGGDTVEGWATFAD